MPLPARARSLAACYGALCAPCPITRLSGACARPLQDPAICRQPHRRASQACLVWLTASRRAVAVDVGNTTRSPAPAAEKSWKEHRLQPALAARRFAQKVAALTTLYALNRALAVAIADAGIQAPSALIGEPRHHALTSLPPECTPAAFRRPILHMRKFASGKLSAAGCAFLLFLHDMLQATYYTLPTTQLFRHTCQYLKMQCTRTACTETRCQQVA